MQVGFSQVRFDGEFEFRMGGTFVNYMQSETEFHTLKGTLERPQSR